MNTVRSNTTPVLFAFICLTLFTIFSHPAHAAEPDGAPQIKTYQALGYKSTDWNSANFKTQLEFKANDFKAQLKQNGEAFIEGGIQHNGLLCGDYEFGIQFGTGTVACTDIKWRTEIQYLSRKTQCNNAFLFHKGAGDFPEVAQDFDAINCAQFVVKCTGTCK